MSAALSVVFSLLVVAGVVLGGISLRGILSAWSDGAETGRSVKVRGRGNVTMISGDNSVQIVHSGHNSTVIQAGGNISITASNNSVAAWQVGEVNIGRERAGMKSPPTPIELRPTRCDVEDLPANLGADDYGRSWPILPAGVAVWMGDYFELRDTPTLPTTGQWERPVWARSDGTAGIPRAPKPRPTFMPRTPRQIAEAQGLVPQAALSIGSLLPKPANGIFLTDGAQYERVPTPKVIDKPAAIDELAERYPMATESALQRLLAVPDLLPVGHYPVTEFAPFTECPRCGSIETHWIAEAPNVPQLWSYTALGEDKVLVDLAQLPADRRINGVQLPPPDPIPNVIRECRVCTQKWGQR